MIQVTNGSAVFEISYGTFVDMIHVAASNGDLEYAQYLESILQHQRDVIVWG